MYIQEPDLASGCPSATGVCESEKSIDRNIAMPKVTPLPDIEIEIPEKTNIAWEVCDRRVEEGEGDKVFLYRSGEGIVAMGIASGKREKKPYPGREEPEDDEYFMKLDKFRKLKQPLPAAEIKKITGVNYRFMSTMFAVDKDSGDKLSEHISKNCI